MVTLGSVDNQNPHGTWKSVASQDVSVRQAWLTEELKNNGHFYASAGWLGQQFEAACKQAAVVEEYDPELQSRASLIGHHPMSGFGGKILYGDKLLGDQNAGALPLARAHEMIHLMCQYQRISATHATPFNSSTLSILLPRAAMILTIMMERQAFAGELLLKDLWAATRDGWLRAENIPAPEYLEARLRRYATHTDPGTRWNSDEGFVEYYCGWVLDGYYSNKNYLNQRKDKNYTNLALEDIKPLNDFFGMKTFADTETELAPYLQMVFPPASEARLQRLNAELGIAENGFFKSHGTVLRENGTTPEQFLRSSLRRPNIPDSVAILGNTTAPDTLCPA